LLYQVTNRSTTQKAVVFVIPVGGGVAADVQLRIFSVVAAELRNRDVRIVGTVDDGDFFSAGSASWRNGDGIPTTPVQVILESKAHVKSLLAGVELHLQKVVLPVLLKTHGVRGLEAREPVLDDVVEAVQEAAEGDALWVYCEACGKCRRLPDDLRLKEGAEFSCWMAIGTFIPAGCAAPQEELGEDEYDVGEGGDDASDSDADADGDRERTLALQRAEADVFDPPHVEAAEGEGEAVQMEGQPPPSPADLSGAGQRLLAQHRKLLLLEALTRIGLETAQDAVPRKLAFAGVPLTASSGPRFDKPALPEPSAAQRAAFDAERCPALVGKNRRVCGKPLGDCATASHGPVRRQLYLAARRASHAHSPDPLAISDIEAVAAYDAQHPLVPESPGPYVAEPTAMSETSSGDGDRDENPRAACAMLRAQLYGRGALDMEELRVAHPQVAASVADILRLVDPPQRVDVLEIDRMYEGVYYGGEYGSNSADYKAAQRLLDNMSAQADLQEVAGRTSEGKDGVSRVFWSAQVRNRAFRMYLAAKDTTVRPDAFHDLLIDCVAERTRRDLSKLGVDFNDTYVCHAPPPAPSPLTSPPPPTPTGTTPPTSCTRSSSGTSSASTTPPSAGCTPRRRSTKRSRTCSRTTCCARSPRPTPRSPPNSSASRAGATR